MGESSSSGSDELDEIHSPSCHSNSKINGSKSKKKSLLVLMRIPPLGMIRYDSLIF